MVVASGAPSAPSEPKSESTLFVDALYRKVLLAVKASNGIPSEDDDYHYHRKFSPEFGVHVTKNSARVQQLLWQLAKSSNKKRSGDDDGASDDDDEAEDGDEELFEGPEPKPKITDLVDTLLDEASKQLEIAVRGDNHTTTHSRPTLENKPMVFDKNHKKKSTTSTADAEETNNNKKQPSKARATNKPQDQFEETIDNSDAPFVSKLHEKVHALHDVGALEEEDEDEDMDGTTRHPYYNEIRAIKYADWQLAASTEPYKKIPVEDASYLWVHTEETLSQMMKSLLKPTSRVIAVDLEHHSYRSYLGLVCLMQISTETEDFLVDTLALRSKLQILNQVFCDPAKVKVLHGADSDIFWLQRDLGLYVVNMFDTGQASRLLNYPRFSLAYLLKRHCNIDADKQYQLADWRIRPLDNFMVKYAREDTRYLLYIYDQMKQELLQASDQTRSSLLFETLQNSSKLCLQVYTKPAVSDEECEGLCEKLKGTVGLPELSVLQKRVFAWLYYWRDRVARQEDESHAYVMPNHVLIKITKFLPMRSDQLFRTCNPVPALVRKHAHEITTMIANEKTKIAAEEAKSSTPNAREAPPVVIPKKRKFEDEEEHAVISAVWDKPLSSTYVGWQSGARKAQPSESDDVVVSLRPSFAAVDASTASVDANIVASLEKVKALVSSMSFVITECSVVESQEQNEPDTSSSAPLATSRADEESEMPKSMAETYNLSNRNKRQKVIVAKPMSKSTTDPPTATPATTTTTTKAAFDYAAASEQVASAKFDLDKVSASTVIPKKPAGGKKNRKTAGGYNPFVAVRGGKDTGGDAPDGAKAPVKKIHQMPRSTTFR